MYDPQIGRWFVPDPANQYWSGFVGMGNNPVKYVDSDGQWVHIAAGAIIGGGFSAYNLYQEGNLEWSWSAASKIALGAGTGALISAIPGASLAAYGIGATGTVAGVSTTLIGYSLAAGAIATASSIADQGIDIISGNSKEINYTKATINGGATALTFGITGHIWGQARYNANKAYWNRLDNGLQKLILHYPNNVAIAMNSFFDITSASIQSNWFNFTGDNLVRGVTPWGESYVTEPGNTVELKEVTCTPKNK